MADELKLNMEDQPKYDSLAEGFNEEPPKRFDDLWGSIKTSDTVPTYVPKKVAEQIVLVSDSLYIYDALSSAWKVFSSAGFQVLTGLQSVGGTLTYTITTGFRPKAVVIHGMLVQGTPGLRQMFSNGGWSLSGGNKCVYSENISSSSSSLAYYVGESMNRQEGLVNNITDTTFDIVNTQAGTGVYATLFWVAFG